MLHRVRKPGNTTTEYALMIGSVALLAITGFNMLGHNTEALFSHANSRVASPQVTDYVNMRFSQANAKNSGAFPGGVDLKTGQPIIPIAANGGGVNATSVDGGVASAQATLMVADKLDALIATLDDPEAADWAKKITRITRYMAGTEGDFSGVDVLSVTTRGKNSYTQANALKDIYRQQMDLQALMSNPPANMDPAEIRQVRTLAREVNQNAADFTVFLEPYIRDNGTINNQQLAQSDYAEGDPERGGMTDREYQNLVMYNKLKQNLAKALEEESDSNPAAFNSTLENANTLGKLTKS